MLRVVTAIFSWLRSPTPTSPAIGTKYPTFLETCSPVRSLAHETTKQGQEDFYSGVINRNYTHEDLDSIIKSNQVSTDWKLYLFGQSITNTLQNRTASQLTDQERLEITEYLEALKNPVKTYLLERGNNDDVILDFYNLTIPDKEHLMRLSSYFLAALISTIDTVKGPFDENLLNVFIDLIKDAATKPMLNRGKEPNNGDLDFLITLNTERPPSAYSFFGTIYHEIEHRYLQRRYEIKCSDNIHIDSIHELRADLSEHTNLGRNISKSISKLKANINDPFIDYERMYQTVYKNSNSYTAGSHYAARAFLQGIVLASEKISDKISLFEIFEKMYEVSEEILDKHTKDSTQNKLKFVDFCRELIIKLNEKLTDKGIIFGFKESRTNITAEDLKRKISHIDPEDDLREKYGGESKTIPNKKFLSIVEKGADITEVPHVTVLNT